MRKNRHIRAIAEGTADAAEEGSLAEAPLTLEHEAADADVEGWDEVEDQAPRPRRAPLVAAALAVLAAIAWTAFFAWTNRAEMLAGASPQRWIEWSTQWSLPILLIAVAWLIGMRSSAREARRFGDAAHVLAQESAALETRLVHVNRELSLAREFLAAQSRELDYVGRSAAERISEHAAKLQALVVDNGAQVDAIAGVSATALANMSELRDNLPVIANSARDVSNQIGGAGRSAKAQLADLVAGFERLNEFGQASERQVVSLRERIDLALEELSAFSETMDANNAARAAALREEAEAARADLAARETEVLGAIRERGNTLREELVAAHDARQLEEAAALAAMRGRVASFTQEAHEAAAAVRAGERAAVEAWQAQIAALRARLEDALTEVAELDRKALETARERLESLTAEAERVDARLSERDREFQARIGQREEDFAAAEESAFTRLDALSEQLDRALAERREAQTSHADAIAGKIEALSLRVGEIDDQLAGAAERSAGTERALANSSEHFATAVGANAAQLAETEGALDRLTDASVRLLELIQAAAQHSKTELPTAIEGFESRLGNARDSSAQIRTALEDAQRLGTEIQATLADMHGAGETAIGGLDAFRSRLSGTVEEQTRALGRLREELSAVSGENRALAENVSEGLGAAVAQLRETAEALLTGFEEDHSDKIAALAARIGEESGAAIDRAVEARTGGAVARLDEATARSADTAREAVAQMRDQLARVHELTANLETRAARAREQVEEQVDNDFARRMALITESLNSHSIDIAKALSTEVTDTAWASYLKGDRGVFTRRAVRLIGSGEGREITQLYESDHEFRDHVSRYIHDFEAMLRTMLSTRDGHALGVTLLSSDMGKLYVVLAQAIQRLRQ